MLVTLLLWSGNSQAQTFAITAATYPMSTSTGASFQDTTGSTRVLFSSNDDTPSGLISFGSGFSFQFNGEFYSGFSISPDGFVRLGSAAAPQFGNDLTSNTNMPIIAAHWDDLATGTDGYANYKLAGTAPNRVAIFDWFVTIPRNIVGPANARFQLALYEANGLIEIVYGGWATSSGSFSLGLRDTVNGVGQFASVTALQPIGTSTVSYAVANNANASVFAAGNKIAFTPGAAPAAPTNLTFSAIGLSSMTLNWTDATGEGGYLIQRSTDGINYTTVATVPANAVSYAASALVAGTNYFWNVIALSEGQKSAALNGSQATNAGVLCGTYSVGPTGIYPTLTAAFNDLRLQGAGCNVILELQAAYTSGAETFPIWTGAVGNGAASVVTVRPELGATGLVISSTNVLGTVLDSLTNYVNFDGRPGGVGTTSQLTITNLNNTATATIAALRITQESSNNSHSYIVFRGNSTSATGGVVVISGSTGASGNDNNSFDNCDFRDPGTGAFPVNCFFAAGQSAGVMNDNCSITNSRIYNFFSASAATQGINIQANNNAWTINGNRIFQDASRTYGAAFLHRGIILNSTAGGSFTISNNIIGYASASGTGTYTMTHASGTAFALRFFGMDINCAASPASTISNNEISGFNIATSNTLTTSSASFCGIWFNAGNATITGNTVGSMTGVDNILVRTSGTSGAVTTPTLIGIGQGAATAGIITISNNNIGGLGLNGITSAFLPNSAIGGTVAGIYNAGFPIASTSNARFITGNNIGGNIAGSLRAGNANQAVLSQTVNFSVVGIVNVSGTVINITNNTIQNLLVPTRSTSGGMIGINSTSGINTITGNTVRNLESYSKNTGSGNAATLMGINHSSTTAPVAGTSVRIGQNTINNLKTASDSTVVIVHGISYTGSTTVGFNYTIDRNRVYDLGDITNTATDTAKVVYSGIGIFGGIPVVQNNMISIGNGNTKGQIYFGLNKNTTNVIRFYHNSVYIGGANTAASGVISGSTAAFRRLARPTSGNDELINNIFYNARTTSFASVASEYGVWLDSTANLTSNKNIFFGDSLNGGKVARRNLTDFVGLAAWKTAGQDPNSIYEDPKYVAPTASTPDLHLQSPPALVPGEMSGILVASVTDDYDGDVRAANSPTDIGADAGNYLPSGDFVNPTIYSVNFTPAGGACTPVSHTVTAVANDASGISAAVINWSLNGVAQTAISMTNVSDSTWTGTIPASGNSSVAFTVTATDGSVNLNTSVSAQQSYQDAALSVNFTAGADQTICPGTPATLKMSASAIGRVRITEVMINKGATGDPNPVPANWTDVVSVVPDMIEVTNLGANTVDIGGWIVEVRGIGARTFTIPAGVILDSGQVATFNIGAGTNVPADRFYNMGGTNNTISSTSLSGFIIRNGSEIVDALAINGFVFSGSPTVSASDWTGSVPSSSGRGGVIRIGGTDSNNASDWQLSNAPSPLITWNTRNSGITIPASTYTFAWAPGGETTQAITVTPVSSPSQYIGTLSDGVCSYTDTVNVSWFTTLPAPVGVDSTHCGNQVPLCYINSVPGATAYRWYTTPTGGTPVQNTIDTTLLSAISTTTTFYVAAFDGVCDGPRVAVTETVTTPDVVDILGTTDSLCLGSTLELIATSVNTNYDYVWSGTGVGFLNTGAGDTVVFSPISSGVYTLIVNALDTISACATVDTFVVSVFENPIVIANIDQTTICEGDTVLLDVSAPPAPTGYLSSAATSTADEDLGNVTFGSINNTTTCTQTGGVGSTLSLYSNYTALAPAVVAPGQSVPYSVSSITCGGNFPNKMAIFIDWNRDGDFLDVNENPVQTATATGPHTKTGTVLVPATASFGFTRMRVICVETSGVIASTGTYTWGETEDYTILVGNANPVTYTWTPAAGLNNPNIANPIATPTVSTTYIVTATDQNTGCSAADSVIINVLPAPVAPVATNSSHCGNKVPTGYVNTVPGATAYYWFDAAVGGNILQAAPDTTYLSAIGTTTTLYVSSFDGSCLSPRTPLTVTVTPAPTVEASASDSSLCEGANTITLTATSTNLSYTYSWTVNTGGALVSTTGDVVTATPSTAGVYSYIVAATDGLCDNLDTVVVTVSANPSIIASSVSDANLCIGGTSSLSVTALPSSLGTFPPAPTTYLGSNATSTADEDLGNVTFHTLNNTTTCAQTGGVGSILNQYSNYTAIPGPIVVTGGTYNYSVSAITCGGNFTNKMAIFIDWNRDGDFNDANENPVQTPTAVGPNTQTGTITVPLTASVGATRMRVINVETTGVIAPTGTYTWGETEDYTINVAGIFPLTYSWTPAANMSTPNAASTVFTVSTSGSIAVAAVITDTLVGCSTTFNTTIEVGVTAPTPSCVNDTVCGQGNITLTATGSGNELFWTDSIGGNILAFNDSLSEYVTASGSHYVREMPSNLDTTIIGYDPINNPSAAVGYFPTTAQGMWFRVSNPEGIILKSVDVIPNGPIGSTLGIDIIDSLGNVVGSVSTLTTVTNASTASPFNFQTVDLNIFVPFSTIPYAIRPTSNPNLSVHQNATVSATAPWQIVGDVQIVGYGNMPPTASFFGTNTFGFFYNWQILHGCFGSACQADYVVNPSPAVAITAGGPTTFCDNGTVSLDAAIGSDPSYVNFTWSPATGLSSTTGAVVTANVSSTTTYTVIADDGLVGGCQNSATITLTVNTAPFADVGAAPDTICSATTLTFNGSGGSASYKYVGTTENPGQTAGWPFNGANLSQRMQLYISVAELNAAGIFGPTFLNSVGFKVANKLSSQPYANFTVSVDTIPTGFGCFFSTTYQTIAPSNTVYTGNYSTVLGWNDIVFQTPYAWDGVHDIVINTCFTNATTSFFDIVYTSATPGCNSTRADNADPCGDLTGALATLRPNLRFQGGAVNYSWTPVTELSATNINNPVFTPSLGTGNRQYVLSVTDPSNGCVATDTLSFYVNNAPAAPVIALAGLDSSVCIAGTIGFTATVVDGSFQWQISNDNVSYTDIPGANASTLTSPVISADSWFRLKAFCTDSSYSNAIFIPVFNPQVTFSEGDTVCGQGNVTLNATANPGYFIQWFTDSLSSAPVSNSNSYSTFVAQTDTFWVRATVDTNSVFGGGAAPSYCAVTNSGSACITNVTFGGINYSTAGCSGGSNYSIIPEATATAQVLLGQSYNLTVTCDGSAITSIWIDYNRDGVFSATEWQQVYTTGTTGTISVNIPVTASGGKTGMRIRSRLSGNTNGPNDACLAMGSGETEDFVITIGQSACSSAKIPVVAFVNAAPAVVVTPSAVTICENSSVNLNVTTGTADYTNFDWLPVTGLNTATGANVVATPSTTTSYIVTASGNVNGCVNSDTAVVTVNPAPVIAVSTANPNLCSGDTAVVTVNVSSPLPGNYTVAAIPHAPLSPVGSSGWGAGPSGDDSQVATTIPFPFTYFGTAYTNVDIYSNGFIQLGTSSGSTTVYGSTIPNAAAPNNIIALAWEDLNVVSPDSIRYYTVGTAPNRRWVAEWVNVDFFVTGGNVSGQIVLNEADNTIDIYHTNIDNFGNQTSCGIENSTGSYGLTPANRNFSVWTPNPVVNEAWKFTAVPPASISWTGQGILGASNTATISAVPTTSSYYTVVVTNPSTGCTKSDSVLINFGVNPQPVILTNDTTLCSPNFVYVKVGDTGAFSGGYPSGTNFEWLSVGGQIVPPTPDLDSIPSTFGSTYYAIVTLPSGCTGVSDTATILTKAVAIVDTITNASCVGGGSILATVTSGIAPYQYVWSTDLAQTNIIQTTNTSSTQDLLSGLAAGTYYLSVSDEFGNPGSCNSGVIAYTVSGSSPIVATATGTDITCNGFGDGSASVSWTGGTAPFSILWSDGNTNATRAVTAAATLTVIVSDLSGCADTASVTINEPAAITLSLSSTNESAPGAFDGTATVVISGGTPGYTVEWFDGTFAPVTTGNPATGLTGDSYTCLVTDTNGCQGFDVVVVSTNTNTTLNLTMLIEGMYDGAGGLAPALLNSGVGLSSTECDTILVEIRDQVSPTTVLASGTAVLGTNGQASFTFPASINGATGYIAVFHRNAVQTWSDLVTFSATTNYNFTTAATQAYFGNQKEVAPGVWAFFSGDVAPQDEVVDIFDVIPMDNDVINFAFGYVPTDLTGDGVVDIFDVIILDNNVINFAASVHP